MLPIQPLLHLSVLWSADFSRQSIAYPGDACHVTTPTTRHVRDERRKMSMAARIEKKWCSVIAVSKWMRPAFRVHAFSVSGAAA